jgi:putative transposase
LCSGASKSSAHPFANGFGSAFFQRSPSNITYYRWRSEYGGLKGDQVKRMKELEAENARLRRAVSDLTVEKLILKEAAAGNF